MKKWISLLRGINVGGSKRILMADLKKLYEDLGFSQVSTYIQSGNVLFTADEKKTGSQLSAAIEKAILKQLGFEVPVITLSVEEVKHLLEKNPFSVESGIDPEKIHLTIFHAPPDFSSFGVSDSDKFLPDRFISLGQAVYIYCPNGYGKTKLNNHFFESQLKINATTRNLRTLSILFEMAGMR